MAGSKALAWGAQGNRRCGTVFVGLARIRGGELQAEGKAQGSLKAGSRLLVLIWGAGCGWRGTEGGLKAVKFFLESGAL